MKRPSFQFYPGDWLRDSIASCSVAAQGLWLRMMIVMHDREPYGHLVIGGKKMTDEAVAKLCGVPVGEYKKLLAELDEAGVPRRTADGVIFSKRMVDDELERKRACNRQAKSRKCHGDVTCDKGVTEGGSVTQMSHASSSSASASSSVAIQNLASGESGSGAEVGAFGIAEWLELNHIVDPLAGHVLATSGVTVGLLESAKSASELSGRHNNPSAIACYRVCKRLGNPVPKHIADPALVALNAIRQRRRSHG